LSHVIEIIDNFVKISDAVMR